MSSPNLESGDHSPGFDPQLGRRVLSSIWHVDRAGVLLAVAGGVAISGKSIIVKLCYQYEVDAVTQLALRMLAALPFALLLGIIASRGARKLSWTDRLHIVWIGFAGQYIAPLFAFAGLEYITASLERLILYLSPTIVLLLGALLGRSRPGRAQMVALAVSYLGVVMAFGHDFDLGGQKVALGSALVFLSATAYAIYILGSGHVVSRIGAMRLTAWSTSVACVLCIGQFLLSRPVAIAASLPPTVWWLSLLSGTVCTVLPVLAIMMAVKRIGAPMAAQVGMIGPLSTIMLSVWLLHEPISWWQIVGTLLVLAGVLSLTRAKII